MDVVKTQRGFGRAEFVDLYGSHCSIQLSSLATDDAIWLGVDKDFTGKDCTRMHLNRDMAEKLISLLKKFVKTGEF